MAAAPSLDGKGVLALKQQFSSYLVFTGLKRQQQRQMIFQASNLSGFFNGIDLLLKPVSSEKYIFNAILLKEG